MTETTDTQTLKVLPAIDKIAAALAKAQAAMSNPTKNKQGQARGGRYLYADLSSVIDAARKPLSDNQLSITQIPTLVEGGRFVLQTLLMHSSGQMLESTYPLPSGCGAQELGSAITYARRYSYCAMIGVVGEDDDDGARANSAGGGAANRDRLIELMGEASLGNKALMEYCAVNSLGTGKTTDDLSDDTVAKLVDTWPDVSAAIKEAQSKKKLPPNAKPVDKPPEKDKPADKPAEPPPAGQLVDTTGMHPKLAELMQKDGITKDDIRRFYTEKKIIPAETPPEKMPVKLAEKIVDRWSEFVASIKPKQ